ncbi:hypothetical protein CPT03_16595 [Pedobacter ginsengisoli]|uniref:Uncharacterized protein n=1 Tax=Pedobacter ginsengisoli TaxID=363852 RepID=A0A2D1U8M2_9SPHI|nr:glycosyltransferase family 4 protein [Pedobacter ginsengisoli]ATP57965.1 hypothetical protein CPT03_16595 [Pedobacter ginsengisoli]
MKILLVSLYYFPKVGGVETSLRYIAKSLKEQGYEVAILAFDGAYEYPNVDGIPVYRYAFESSKISYILHKRIKNIASIAIEKVIDSYNPDQIWSRNSIVAAGLIRCNRVKVVKHIFSTTSNLNVDGLYSNLSSYRFFKRTIFKGLKILDRYSLSRIDRNLMGSPKIIGVVFSKMMKKQLLEETGIKSKVIHVIQPGVDRTIFDVQQYPEEVLNEIPLIKDKYVLYVGRIAPAKNLEILIDSFINLNGVRLNIVGDGPYLPFLKQYVQSKGMKNKVFFLGAHKKYLPLLYSKAELTVLPTKIETFGQVLIESLSCGTPVVGFGKNPDFKTAIDEIVINDYNGIVVNEFSAIELSNAIQALIAIDPSIKENMRAKNIEYIEKHFCWNTMVNETLKLE